MAVYCPECKHAYPDGTAQCPKDRLDLVDELPVHSVDGPTTTWVELTSVAAEDEARLLQGFLESEGIACEIESLKFHEAPVNFGSMGEIRMYVSAEQEQEAKALLADRERSYASVDDEESEQIVTDDGPASIDETSEAEAPRAAERPRDV